MILDSDNIRLSLMMQLANVAHACDCVENMTDQEISGEILTNKEKTKLTSSNSMFFLQDSQRHRTEFQEHDKFTKTFVCEDKHNASLSNIFKAHHNPI